MDLAEPLVSLAVLADDRHKWRPTDFTYENWGCRLRLDFPAVKLLDYEWDRLEASSNPFAVFVQAHLKSLETRRNPKDRLRWKLALVKGLYEKGYSREEIVRLFSFVDWLMELPDGLGRRFEHELADFEEGKKMTYVTSIERSGIKKGLEVGLEKGRLQMARENVVEALEIRFGSVPAGTKETIHRIADSRQLRGLLKHAIEAPSLQAFEMLLSDLPSDLE